MSLSLQELGRAVKRLQSRHHRRLDGALHAHGTSLAQWDALRAIGEHPGVSAHALAELTFQTDQAFGALTARLIAKGLVTREAGLGRALVHALTAEGRRTLEEGSVVVDRMLEQSFGGLTPAERAALFRLVGRALGEGEAGSEESAPPAPSAPPRRA